MKKNNCCSGGETIASSKSNMVGSLVTNIHILDFAMPKDNLTLTITDF